MSEKLLIHLDYCLTPLTRINNAAIVIENGYIQSLGGFSAYVQKENFEIIELPGCYAVPGFIDTRLYGAAKFDCMHADSSDNLDDMSLALAEHGVTSFLPTTQSSSHDHLLSVISALADRVNDETLKGAVPIGLHIEGPYISPERPGAHQVRYIQPIDLGKAHALYGAYDG